MSIRDVNEMTLWQYTAMIVEHNKRQKNPSGVEPMSEDEYDEMIDEFRSWNLPDVRL